MTTAAALILATVLYTAPDSAASDTACVAAGPLVSPLSHVTLWGQVRYGAEPRVLGSRTVIAGASDSISFEDGDSVWTVWTVVTSMNGRTSCESQRIGVNLTADVSPAVYRSTLFDVAGRAIKEPRVPGIYFERTSNGMRRLVVLR